MTLPPPPARSADDPAGTDAPERLPAALAAWMRAGRARDGVATAAVLAPDVVMVSPLTDSFRFEGRAEVVEILTEALGALEEIEYERVEQTSTGALLTARARLGGIDLHEAQLLDLDEHGDIAGITIFLRPLPAATRLLEALGPRIVRRQGRRGVAALLTVAGGFLHRVAASGDRRFLPLAAPPRVRRR